MILGIDPLYLILLMMAAVALGLGAFGVVMYKLLGKLTVIANTMLSIHSIINKPTMHPPFTQSMIEQVESKLAELRLADRETSPVVVAELADIVATLQQVTRPVEVTAPLVLKDNA